MNNFASTAANVYGTLQQRKAPAPTIHSAPVADTSWMKFLPWGIGALVLLLAIGMFTRR